MCLKEASYCRQHRISPANRKDADVYACDFGQPRRRVCKSNYFYYSKPDKRPLCFSPKQRSVHWQCAVCAAVHYISTHTHCDTVPSAWRCCQRHVLHTAAREATECLACTNTHTRTSHPVHVARRQLRCPAVRLYCTFQSRGGAALVCSPACHLVAQRHIYADSTANARACRRRI